MREKTSNLPAAGASPLPCTDPPRCNHSMFRSVFFGGWNDCPEGVTEPCVFVFERPHWKTPTARQIAKYEKNKKIVERLGGRMRRMAWEIAGINKPLSREDVTGILAAVIAAAPQSAIISHWNGAGCYTMSVGVDLQGALDSATPQAKKEVQK